MSGGVLVRDELLMLLNSDDMAAYSVTDSGFIDWFV